MIPGNPASTGERVESQPIETAATPTSAGPQGETVSQETASAAGEAVEKGDPTAALEALSAKPPERNGVRTLEDLTPGERATAQDNINRITRAITNADVSLEDHLAIIDTLVEAELREG